MAARVGSWWEWEHRVLRELYRHLSHEQIAAILGRTASSVKARAEVLRLRRTDRRQFTREEIAKLRALYPYTSTEDVARALGKSVGGIWGIAKRLGLTKADEYRAAVARKQSERMRNEDHPGRATQFKEGLVPHNKGLRQPGWAPGRMKETQFKPGDKPHSWLPVGTERVAGDGYLVRKIEDKPRRAGGWRAVHVLMWEEANGPIPPNHVVIFKDHNPAHLSLENLELIDRAALMRRNSIHARLSPELKSTVYAMIALKRKITMKEKAGKAGGGAIPKGGSGAKEHAAGSA